MDTYDIKMRDDCKVIPKLPLFKFVFDCNLQQMFGYYLFPSNLLRAHGIMISESNSAVIGSAVP